MKVIPTSHIASMLNYLSGLGMLIAKEGQPAIWARALNQGGRYDWVQPDDLLTAADDAVACCKEGQLVNFQSYARALDRVGNRRVSAAPPALDPPGDPVVYPAWLAARADGLRRGLPVAEAEKLAWAGIKQLPSA